MSDSPESAADSERREGFECPQCGKPMEKREQRRPLTKTFGEDVVWTRDAFLVCPNGHTFPVS